MRPLGAEAAALPTQSTPLTAPLAHAASSKVRAIARLGEPVAPLVIEDFEPHPAYDPVIGPDLAAARTRVGLSVDELADRTRIRPHVIESIEVDDFTPCGGDFYARGHIRTLARVLGKDPAPMLAAFDSRYATAPISPRRVFEAELATGLTGSMRSTRGGPNWALMIGAVLTLVLVWSAVRLFSVDSETAFETPPPVLNGSSGIGNGFGEPAAAAAAPRSQTTLAAVQAGANVEVRDGEGALVFEGDLVIGEVKTLQRRPAGHRDHRQRRRGLGHRRRARPGLPGRGRPAGDTGVPVPLPVRSRIGFFRPSARQPAATFGAVGDAPIAPGVTPFPLRSVG